MRKMTPMILVILMLASVLSSIDVYELQEQKEFEETSARAGADAEVVFVTSPRETLMAGDEVTNQLLAGDPVNFKAYLRNGGDADLTNMQYQVTVYDSVSGERGEIATDPNGNSLAWSNDNAVCANSCQNSVLTPGEFIDGGESTLVTSAGNVIVWTPKAGEYIVEVKVTSLFAGDPANDEISYPVSVKDYYDIVMDMHWLDSNGDSVEGAVEGVNPTDFKITLEIVGSMPDVKIRNATVQMDVYGGTVSASTYVVEILGEQRTVEISDDGQGVTQTGQRMMIGADAGGPIVGEVTLTLDPPLDGDYSVEASLKSYTLYGTEGCDNPGESCERTLAGVDAEDEFNGNNIGSVYGSGSTVHDISLGDFFLMSVVDETDAEDEEGYVDAETYGSIGEEITETLSTGTYDLVAMVEHTASSSLPIYDWNVVFTITDSSGTPTTITAVDCDIEEFDYESYMYLGIATDRTDASPTAVVCAEASMQAGEFNVMAEANIIGLYDETEEQVDTKVGDMIQVNNREDYDITVENFAPTILSLRGQTIAIAGDTVTLSGTAFDVEDDELVYSWFDGSGNPMQCDGDSSQGVCSFVTDVSMVPSYKVRMTVEDGYNTVDEDITIEVLVSETFTAEGLADGFAAVYSITAKTSGMTVGFADGPLDAVNINECANAATPVGAVTVDPSTTYDSSVLMSQTITVHFPANLGVQYMWMESGATMVTVASGEADVVDASTSGYTYSFPSGADMIPSGTNFYLIADDCETADPPAGTITQLSAEPAMGGDIVINYNYDTLLSDETVRISVTESGSSTPARTYDRVESDTRSITWSSGTDGQEYTVTAQLCNQYSCGDATTATVTSDASVAAVTATSITIAEAGENWDVAWQVSAVDEDVAGWYVCWNKGEFTATEMKTLIDSGACMMVADGTQVSIAKYTTVETTQVHFGIVPYDAVMNVAYGPSTDNILYDRAQDTSNPDDGTTTTDSETSSGVPTWTWGVIGAVVVVAFIVGAFILSRGDGEGDDDKEWDY